MPSRTTDAEARQVMVDTGLEPLEPYLGHTPHPRAMMKRLGHSSINATLDTYKHLFPALDEALTE